MITIAYDQSVRTLMQNAGYDGSKIGYDQNTNTVTYDNRPFYKGGMNVNGTVFTDNPSFTQAHSQYQKTYGPGTIFTPQDNNTPYEQRLANYAQNPSAANAELNRANQVSAYNQATGSNNADTVAHIGRLQQIMAAQQPQQQGPNVNDLISQVLQRVNNPQAYDVYNSPEYKAAQEAEAYQSQQATRGAQEALGEAGFGRSTNLADRAQMIQNDANQRLLTQVVPQLIANHRAQDQQQLGNLTSLISPLLQQQQMTDENAHFDKTFGLQQNQFDYGKQKDQRDFDYQQARDAIKDKQYQEQFDFDKQKYGMEYALKRAIELGQLDVSRMNAATSAGNLALSQDRFNYEKDPNNPDNLYKQAEIEWRKSEANKNNAYGGANQKELEGLYTGLSSGKIDPASALDEINVQTKAGIYTPQQAAIMTNLVQQYARSVPRQPIRQLSPNEVSKLEQTGGKNYQNMNAKQIEQEWSNDPTGEAAGTALYDWSAWVRDPRGRMAGVSYPAYQQAYGARLSAK